jgi:hypothetical protein
VLVTAGLAGLVYGLVHAAEVGWGSPQALLVLVVSAVLLLAFAPPAGGANPWARSDAAAAQPDRPGR